MSGAQPVELPGLWATRRRERWMGRVTWLTVGVAFVVWLALAAGGAVWAHRVLELSSAPAPSTLEAVDGVVLYREADQRKDASAQHGMQIFDGDELATRLASAARLRIFDGSILEIYPDTRIQVRATRIGRFNPGATQAGFNLLEGAMRLSIPPTEDRAHAVSIATPHGEAAFAPGEYTLRVGSDGTRVSLWSGRCAVLTAEGVEEIEPGQKVRLMGGAVVEIGDLLEDLVANGDFVESFQGWALWESREQGRPDARGQRDIIVGEGPEAPPRALRVTRTSQVDAHNETGLSQVVARDVRGARAVRLEACVKLTFATLSGGGYLGSEYPMMIRVRYHDNRGVEGTWNQGFYYANPENRPTPVGRQVERGVWTTFAVDLLPLLNRPSSIDAIEVFGAGHTFDAAIGGVKLLVD